MATLKRDLALSSGKPIAEMERAIREREQDQEEQSLTYYETAAGATETGPSTGRQTSVVEAPGLPPKGATAGPADLMLH